jgi:hypothetical protein
MEYVDRPQPGTVRSYKKRIFSDDITYGKVF